jgi:thiol-disulfide isomerase/thioredoxin
VPSADPSVAVQLTQPWATAELTDVATGEPFRIADHAGKILFIETMAIWCTKCRDQQADALEALRRLDDPNVVYVVLDTDPGESAADLAAYEKKRGWEAFMYAISPRNVSRALAADFGDFVLNPPSTPLIVVGTDGTVTLTEFRHKGVDELIALARQHGA